MVPAGHVHGCVAADPNSFMVAKWGVAEQGLAAPDLQPIETRRIMWLHSGQGATGLATFPRVGGVKRERASTMPALLSETMPTSNATRS
jgi:hypothetical protein